MYMYMYIYIYMYMYIVFKICGGTQQCRCKSYCKIDLRSVV